MPSTWIQTPLSDAALHGFEQLERLVQGSFRPDMTLLLDLPVAQGMQRASARGELDRFESEQLDFFERVRACYLQRAERCPGRYRRIDASAPLESVQRAIARELDRLLAGAGERR